VQVPADVVKNILPVRNNIACAQVSDRPMNDQPLNRNGKDQRGIQAPEGPAKNQTPVRSGGTRGIQQGMLPSWFNVTSRMYQTHLFIRRPNSISIL
jgi:hypothetical protein